MDQVTDHRPTVYLIHPDQVSHYRHHQVRLTRYSDRMPEDFELGEVLVVEDNAFSPLYEIYSIVNDYQWRSIN